MEVNGKILKVLDIREGQSERGMWKIASYLMETIDRYPKKMSFDVSGADKIDRLAIREGQELTIYFDVDAREYQGKWYNSIRAYDARPIQAVTTEEAVEAF